MQVIINVNPDEALALIQVLEHDIMHRDLSQRVIEEVERYRHEWARRELLLNGKVNASHLPATYMVLTASNREGSSYE